MFLNNFIDVTCLPNLCEEGMIPWPGYPNQCFKVNKEVHTTTTTTTTNLFQGNSGSCRLVKNGDEVTIVIINIIMIII